MKTAFVLGMVCFVLSACDFGADAKKHDCACQQSIEVDCGCQNSCGTADAREEMIKEAVTEFVAPTLLDECPTGNECGKIANLYQSICVKSPNPDKDGYRSICTLKCLAWDDGTSAVYEDFGIFGGSCDGMMKNGDSCCGLVEGEPPDFGIYGQHFCMPPKNCCANQYGKCGLKCCTSDEVCEFALQTCKQCEFESCGQTCCAKEEICDHGTLQCEPKCQPPAPLFCEDECCPNNYKCECEESGGFCLPLGAMMCDCELATWCEPLQECTGSWYCQEVGKPCKPLGAEDCPLAENCYCDPGYLCTSAEPPCCPGGKPVPCGDYCCPPDNECVPEIKACKAPGEDYCPAWKIICSVGKDCLTEQSGCKNDGEVECGGGQVCAVNNVCVGAGNGENGSGCCPGSTPVACLGYCCPGGTDCDPGCGGCVETSYKCCPDGKTVCLDKKICWSGGEACLDTAAQDCGSYHCGASEVCSSGPQKCCPESLPQTCGSICCETGDTCHDPQLGGICVNEAIGEEYCGNLLKCDQYEDCMKNVPGCMPQSADECIVPGMYCESPKKCCNSVKEIYGGEPEKYSICQSPGESCCEGSSPDGKADACVCGYGTQCFKGCIGPNCYVYCIPAEAKVCMITLSWWYCPASYYCKIEIPGYIWHCCDDNSDKYDSPGCSSSSPVKQKAVCTKPQ